MEHSATELKNQPNEPHEWLRDSLTLKRLMEIPSVEAGWEAVTVAYSDVKNHNFVAKGVLSFLEVWFIFAMTSTKLFALGIVGPYVDKKAAKYLNTLLETYPILDAEPHEVKYEIQSYMDELASTYPLTNELLKRTYSSYKAFVVLASNLIFAVYYAVTLPFRIPIILIEKILNLFLQAPSAEQLKEASTFYKRGLLSYKRILAALKVTEPVFQPETSAPRYSGGRSTIPVTVL